MKRVIRNIATLDAALLSLMDDQFPNGIRKEDLMSFPTSGGKRIYGIELKTEEVTYLVRVSNLLALGELGPGPKIDYALQEEALMGDQ